MSIVNWIKWLFDKNTRRGRGFRTAFQGVLGLMTFLYGILVIPGFGSFLADNNLVTIGTFGIWLGVVSYLQNAFEDFMKWLG